MTRLVLALAQQSTIWPHSYGDFERTKLPGHPDGLHIHKKRLFDPDDAADVKAFNTASAEVACDYRYLPPTLITGVPRAVFITLPDPAPAPVPPTTEELAALEEAKQAALAAQTPTPSEADLLKAEGADADDAPATATGTASTGESTEVVTNHQPATTEVTGTPPTEGELVIDEPAAKKSASKKAAKKSAAPTE